MRCPDTELPRYLDEAVLNRHSIYHEESKDDPKPWAPFPLLTGTPTGVIPYREAGSGDHNSYVPYKRTSPSILASDHYQYPWVHATRGDPVGRGVCGPRSELYVISGFV